MGLFVKVENKGKYLFIHRRKLSSPISFIPLICYFIIFPLIYSIIKTNFILIALGVLILLFFIFGLWFAIEGIYYGKFFPKKYEKQGKKVERRIGEGIKIYKT